MYPKNREKFGRPKVVWRKKRCLEDDTVYFDAHFMIAMTP